MQYTEDLHQDARLRCQRLVLQYGSKKKLANRLAAHGVTSNWLYKIIDGRIQSPGTQALDRLLRGLEKIEKKV